MRLYATVRASRGGAVARKGDNKELVTVLSRGNKEAYNIVFKEETLLVYRSDTMKILLEEKGERQKGEKCGKCASNPKWDMFDSCEH